MERKIFTLVLLLGMLLIGASPVVAQEEPPIVDADLTSALLSDRVPPQEWASLSPAAGEHVPVIIELEQAPLAVKYAESDHRLPAATQRDYVAQLEKVQAGVEAHMAALDVEIFDRYQRVYNGFLAHVPAGQIDPLAALPGVKAVHPAPIVYPELAYSVPLIGADVVSDVLGYDGTGVTIGIIDTGIDYTHLAFGGSGNMVDYQLNDPEVDTDYPTTTLKIGGGWDFAGTDYDLTGVPVPDPDPMDYDGHGTHVASIAAGWPVSGTLAGGVAPGATLYALKISGDYGSTSSSLIVSAIEWATDPNGDGDLSDHLDVINMSLGWSFGEVDAANPMHVAIENATSADVVVVTSAGNAGDTHFITGGYRPGAADSAIAVANSTTGYDASSTPTVLHDGTYYEYAPADLDDTPDFETPVTGELFDVATVQTTITPSLCITDGFAVGDLTGKIALALFHTPGETGCTGSQQVNNAAQLGAKAVLLRDYTTRTLFTLIGDPAPIPAGTVTITDGVALQAAHGQTVTISSEFSDYHRPSATPADTIHPSSSRGPRQSDGAIKPELTAPGTAIVAAKAGTGMDAVGYTGTSMAAPHVAGAAALMVEAHPAWSPYAIKAALMNTAVDLADGSWVPRYGAGRVDARAAAEAETLVSTDSGLVSLSWGYTSFTETHQVLTDTLYVYNEGGEKTFDIDWQFSTTQTLQSGIDLELPPTVTVGAGEVAVDVTLWITATEVQAASLAQGVALGRGNVLEEYHGFVTLTNQAVPTEVLRLPFYVIPRPYTDVAGAVSLADPRTLTSTVILSHTGALSSSLATYATYAVDPYDDLGSILHSSLDPLDVHLVGMGHYEHMGVTTLKLLVKGWGAGTTLGEALYNWIIPMLWVDVNEDGTDDYQIIALSQAQHAGEYYLDDYWLLLAADMQLGNEFVAGAVRTDYYAGYQEWHIFADALGIDATTNPDFNFRYSVEDMYWGYTLDETDSASYDLTQPHIDARFLSGALGPNAPFERLDFNVLRGGVRGLMIVDYNAKPGEEVLFISTDYKIYLPLSLRDS